MKKLITMIAFVAIAGSASAALLYSESFVDMTGWTQNGTVSNIVSTATGLSGFGITNASGNAATAEDQRSSAYDGTNSMGQLSGSGSAGGTLYMSFLVNSASVGGWGGAFHVGLSSSKNTYAPIWGVGVDRDEVGGGLIFSVAAGANAGGAITTTDVSGGDVTLGSNYLVVAKLDWLDTGAWQQTVNGLTVSMSAYDTSAPASEPVVWDLTHTEDKLFPLNDPAALIDQVYVSKGASSMETVVDEIRVGTSFADVSAGFVPNTEAPSAATNLVATASSASEIDLSWDDTSDSEDGFAIERGLATNSYSVIATNAADDTTYPDTGLEQSTEYFYRVTAFNDIGSSTNNPTASATTQVAPPPAAPSGLEAATVGSSEINLGWDDNSVYETAFIIERKVGAGAFAPIATNAADAASFADTGLAASTEYTYRVKATNPSGDSAYTAEASATTLSVGMGTALILYEPFVYGAAIGQPISTEAAWTDSDADGNNGIVRAGLTMTGYPAFGKAVATDNTETDYRAIDIDYFESYGTLYLSGMFKADVGGQTWGGSSLVSFSLSSDTYAGRLVIGLTNGDTIDDEGASNQIHAFAGSANSINEVTVENDVAVATNSLTADTTYFVLAKLEITGAASNTMDISLMVIEDGGVIPTNEPATWDAVYTDASYENFAVESIWQNLDRLNVEQGNSPGTAGVSNQADEFRAAKTYTAALPGSPGIDPYDTWVALYGLTGDDALLETDIEPDGLDNLSEYGLSGNPTNSDKVAVYPVSFFAEDAGSNYLYRIHNERTNDPTLHYTVGTKLNLVVFTHWDTSDIELVGESAVSGDFKSVTNRTGRSDLFKALGLKISK